MKKRNPLQEKPEKLLDIVIMTVMNMNGKESPFMNFPSGRLPIRDWAEHTANIAK